MDHILPSSASVLSTARPSICPSVLDLARACRGWSTRALGSRPLRALPVLCLGILCWALSGLCPALAEEIRQFAVIPVTSAACPNHVARVYLVQLLVGRTGLLLCCCLCWQSLLCRYPMHGSCKVTVAVADPVMGALRMLLVTKLVTVIAAEKAEIA